MNDGRQRQVLGTLLLLGSLGLSCSAIAQVPPDTPLLVGSTIEASAQSDPNTGIFTYRYTVANGADSTGHIWLFGIDLTSPSDQMTLGSEGLVNGPRFLDHSSRVILESPNTPRMVPVGLTSPLNWSAGLAAKGWAQWGSHRGAFRIFPGKTLNGFEITSYGLPGIRLARLDPKYEPDVTDNVTREMLEADQRVIDNISVTHKTIGPTAPPATLVPLDFIAYLEDLKHQAQALGWITNDGVVKSLDVKLDQVRKHLAAGSTKTAGNVLQAFMNEVSAQGCSTYEACPPGKHLSPEASGLLYFNAKYLLEHL